MPWRSASRPAATSPAGPAPITIASYWSVASAKIQPDASPFRPRTARSRVDRALPRHRHPLCPRDDPRSARVRGPRHRHARGQRGADGRLDPDRRRGDRAGLGRADPGPAVARGRGRVRARHGRIPGRVQAGRAERPHAHLRARAGVDRPRPGGRRHRRDQRAEGDRAEGREGRAGGRGGRSDRPERSPVRHRAPRRGRGYPLPRDRAARARAGALHGVDRRVERPAASNRRGRHLRGDRRRTHRHRAHRHARDRPLEHRRQRLARRRLRRVEQLLRRPPRARARRGCTRARPRRDGVERGHARRGGGLGRSPPPDRHDAAPQARLAAGAGAGHRGRQPVRDPPADRRRAGGGSDRGRLRALLRRRRAAPGGCAAAEGRDRVARHRHRSRRGHTPRAEARDGLGDCRGDRGRGDGCRRRVRRRDGAGDRAA